MLDQKLLSILACPVCKGDLYYDKKAKELICRLDRLAYPVRDGVPVMLSTEARQLSLEEREQFR
ncbi:MAG: Trm112 family protein [Gammaproteobacteria bacterium]|nr:Trm112 family protein [Gammaproteobacteria bacterium]